MGSSWQRDLIFNHAAGQANPWLWSLIHGVAVLFACVGIVLFWHVTEDVQEKSVLARRLADAEAGQRQFTSDLLVNLARRNQSMLYRQLEIINQLEESERDPDTLAELFTLDHLATRVRRNAESLLVLSGEQPPRTWSQPVPIRDVLRAAIAETEDLDRVVFVADEQLAVAGHTVTDLTHLIAELTENAVRFSPPDSTVSIRARPNRQQPGGQVLTVEDWGVGMPPAQLAAANALLAKPPEVDLSVSQRLGFHVVARLAARHRIGVVAERDTRVRASPRRSCCRRRCSPPTGQRTPSRTPAAPAEHRRRAARGRRRRRPAQPPVRRRALPAPGAPVITDTATDHQPAGGAPARRRAGRRPVRRFGLERARGPRVGHRVGLTGSGPADVEPSDRPRGRRPGRRSRARRSTNRRTHRAPAADWQWPGWWAADPEPAPARRRARTGRSDTVADRFGPAPDAARRPVPDADRNGSRPGPAADPSPRPRARPRSPSTCPRAGPAAGAAAHRPADLPVDPVEPACASGSRRPTSRRSCGSARRRRAGRVPAARPDRGGRQRAVPLPGQPAGRPHRDRQRARMAVVTSNVLRRPQPVWTGCWPSSCGPPPGCGPRSWCPPTGCRWPPPPA